MYGTSLEKIISDSIEFKQKMNEAYNNGESKVYINKKEYKVTPIYLYKRGIFQKKRRDRRRYYI